MRYRFGGLTFGRAYFRNFTVASQCFRDKKKQQQMPTLSFDLISMSTLTWITEKELERELKTKGDQFHWKKNKKNP